MFSAGPQIRDGGVGSDITYPFFHTVELLLQDGRISIGQINHPGADSGGISPGGTGIGGLQKIRDHMADITVFRLVRSQISQPFCIEFFSIIIKAGSTDKDLGIAGPAQMMLEKSLFRLSLEQER